MRYQAAWFVLAAFCLPPSLAIAQHSGDSVREVFYPTVAMSDSYAQPMVVVDRGFLIAIRNRNYLIVHDRDGKFVHLEDSERDAARVRPFDRLGRK